MHWHILALLSLSMIQQRPASVTTNQVCCLSAECGSASGGGVAGVTDRFLASFLFLDRLGLAAKLGVSLLVRESLYSGNYALIHLHTITPNPVS